MCEEKGRGGARERLGMGFIDVSFPMDGYSIPLDLYRELKFRER